MDAKPHRPLRNFRVRDENFLPTTFPSKTIHQRGKSSPALSTLVSQQAGPLKPSLGRTRTAFADVSNTARVNHISKDDNAIASTKTASITLKEINGADQSRAAALSRPAQRPLSVSGISRFLHNFTSNSSSSAKQASSESRSELEQSAPLRKARSKKSTAILRDVIDQDPLLHQEPVNQVDEHHDASIIPGPYQPTQPDMSQYSYNEIGQSKAVEHRFEPQTHALPPIPSPSVTTNVRSDGVHLHMDSEPEYLLAPPSSSFGPSEIYVDASSHMSHPEPLKPTIKPNQTYVPLQQPHVASLDALLELDERITKEQYPGHFEDDGYTTARSFRSKGDYTTGSTTVLLAPRVTERVEREIAAAKQVMLDTRATDEIEEDESWDTSMVAEYGDDIFEYMHQLEERMCPNPYYMDAQTEVQWSMRSVLMDWLIQVHHRFQLLPETLFLCVNYIDRFLSCKVVSINKLQLVGATAILVAAKYEEIQCPTVSEICYMVEGSYKVEEILKAERFMLSMLQFELGWPGPMSFLRRISKADDYDLETRTLAKYFLEVTIMDERFVGSVPSFTAAGAHCLARLMLRKGIWTPAHVYYSNYTYSQLRPLLVAMLSCCDDPLKHHQAVFDKYGDKRFKRASYFVQSELDKGFSLPPVTRTSSIYSAESMNPTGQEDEWKSKAELSFV